MFLGAIIYIKFVKRPNIPSPGNSNGQSAVEAGGAASFGGGGGGGSGAFAPSPSTGSQAPADLPSLTDGNIEEQGPMVNPAQYEGWAEHDIPGTEAQRNKAAAERNLASQTGTGIPDDAVGGGYVIPPEFTESATVDLQANQANAMLVGQGAANVQSSMAGGGVTAQPQFGGF